MNKLLFTVTLTLLSLSVLKAQNAPQKLQFNPNGEFRIAQFTDMHMGKNDTTNQIVFKMINEVIETQKPDMIVFTGDNTICDDVQGLWNRLSKLLSEHKIPWTAVLGNHDDEYAVNRKDIIEIIRRQPYCVLQNSENPEGKPDHVVQIYDSKQKDKLSALLYCMDSNAYSTIDTVKGYGWFDFSQVEWYRKKSSEYTAKNNGKPYPALAFFHIPLPEYTQAWESFATRRYGDRNEKECSPRVNSGMYLAMLQAGDVMGTFVGHDHVNDYIATYYNIALAYGRASGGKNSYGDKIPGSRIIVLKEGQHQFDTWIHELGNNDRINFCSYPGSFVNK